MRFGRRRFLESVAGLAATASYSVRGESQERQPGESLNIFDGGVLVGPYHRRAVDARLETVLTLLDQAGIGRALVTSLVGLEYSSEEGNRHILQVCRQYPSRLVPCATVHPLDFVFGSQLGKRFREEGFKAVGFYPHHQQWSLELISFQRCIQEISEAGLPVLVSIGNPEEVSQLSRVSAEIRSPVVVRAPTGSGYRFTSEYLSAGESRPNLYFDVVNLIACGSIELLAQRLGAERLMFSSHIPFFYPLSSLYLVQYADLTPEQREAIAGGTIRRLLGYQS